APQRLGVGPVALADGGVVDHVGVHGVDPLDVHLALGGVGTGLQAGQEPGLEQIEASDGRGPDDPLGPGVVGNDVGPVTTVGDDPVDALGGLDVLAQSGHVHVPEHDRVQRVAPLVGRGGGVGGLAGVGDVRLVQGDDV